ncbi:MAG: SprB repeat-containing protein [Flavobacteriia bacterium]|jgi:hypothetical protein
MKTSIKNLKLTLAALIAGTFTSTFSFGQGTKLPLSVTIQATNPTCNGSADGSLFFTVSGGFAPYYLNGTQITNDTVSMTGLVEGSYDFTFTDVSLAMSEGTAVLFAPQAPVISAVVSDVTTATPNGSIDLTVTSAYGPVTFDWFTYANVNWNANDEDQFNLGQGIYLVTISEANGCQFAKRFTVNNNYGGSTPPNIQPNLPSSLIVYPNPSSGSFQLKSDKQVTKVMVTNEIGQIMILDEAPDQSLSYDLKPGKYTVISVDTDNNTSRSHLTIR